MLRSLFLFLFGLATVGVSASAASRVAVLNGNDNTLSLVDLATGQPTLSAFAFPGFPGNGVVRGGKLYVAVSGADLVMVLDVSTLAPLDTLFTGAGTNPYAVEVSDAGDVFASLFRTDQVVKFDSGGHEVGRVVVGRAPEGLLFDDGRLYVADSGIRLSDFGYDAGTITVLDAGSLANLGTVPVGLNPQWLHVAGGELHVICTGDYYSVFGEIHIVSRATLAPVDTVVLGGSPGFLEIAGDIGYASDYFGGIASYRLSTREVLRSFADPIAFGGDGYSGMVIDESGNLYVALYGDDLLVRVRLSDGTPEATYPAGDGPSSLALIPETPVPVRLLAFAAESTLRGVEIRWTVARDTDPVRFRVERADRDGSWSEIVEVAADELVTTSEGQTAGVIDAEAPAGRLQYRLSAVLRDGSVDLLGTRVLQHEPPARPPLVVRPVMNPARGTLAVAVSGSGDGAVRVALVSTTGRIVLTTQTAPGETNIVWNVSDLSPGIYFLRASEGSRTGVSRVVLLP